MHGDGAHTRSQNKHPNSQIFGGALSVFFSKEQEHNPGGKIQWPLLPGVQGGAVFSKCKKYRPVLYRWSYETGPSALWIGMNPSTARADVDDPTIRWEWIYTQRWLNCTNYVKCNVFDYRATDPKDLLEVEPLSKENYRQISLHARTASHIICSWGKLHNSLRYSPEYVFSMLKRIGCDPMCLGMNSDGSPKHPLFLKRDVELTPYHG